MSKVVYFSRMFQAVPHLAQVASQLPGTFVTTRSSTLKATRHLYPALDSARFVRWLGPFSQGARLLKNADVIVTGSPYRSFLKNFSAKKCTVFHGTYMLLSKHALLANAHFDLLCVTGPRMQQMIQRFASEIQVNTVRTGFLPFCEFPVATAEHRERTLGALNLDPSLKTVVYTSSRRSIGSWDLVAEQLVRTTPASFNLVLRPHPSQSLTSRRIDRASFRRVTQLAASRPNTLVDLTAQALSSLQSVADLLISDANSPAEESLFYDVPQLFIETPIFGAEAMRTMALREEMHPDDIAQLLTLFECGRRQFVDGPMNFAQSIERAILDAPVYASRRQEYFSWVFGERDRCAHKRAAQAIKTFLLS
ncbi:hypothetical protein [Pseudothauera lacus]|uniref:CDP-glycerol:poly(Glycerophosphate) glycerophosphotransferase n=1 Tax=Pseudothauera lacus TaxID=2136175 RepID=A0A2T4ICL5_9RHOO|nr:hypothetical protein [Pseudothauera lacus]PTD95510.1 hypothetical protein C8261_13720 [Pseudothauera lacus]